jgi:hypothetical protein
MVRIVILAASNGLRQFLRMNAAVMRARSPIDLKGTKFVVTFVFAPSS